MQRDKDLSALSNAYLKALIVERGYSHDGLLTREELLARAEEAAATPHLPSLGGEGGVEDGWLSHRICPSRCWACTTISA